MAPVVLGFETMAAVSGVYVGVPRLSNGRLPDDPIGAGVDRFDLIAAGPSYQDASTVGCDSQPMGHTTDVDASNELVRAGVDD